MTSDTEDDDLWEQVKRSVVPMRKGKDLRKKAAFESRGSSKNLVGSKPHIKTETAEFRPGAAPVPAAPVNLSMDTGTFRKISKGRMRIDATLDLHGMTQTEAHASLLDFFDDMRHQGRRTVLIITGKGMLGKGILREMVPFWFSQMPFKRVIVGYSEAHSSHGGSGALYVRLKKIGGDGKP